MKSNFSFIHPFIEERYWHESAEAIVRDVYLPAAQTSAGGGK